MEGTKLTKLKHGDIIPGLCFKEYVAAIANLVWSIEVPARQGFEWLYLDADNLKLLPIAESTEHDFSVIGKRIFDQLRLICDMEGWVTPDIFLCRRSKGAVVYADPCVLEHFKKVLADAAAAWLRFPSNRPTESAHLFNTSDVLAFLMQHAQNDQHKLTILIALAQVGRYHDASDYLATLA